MLDALIMQTINDFTCSLTNHNVLWLNIYNTGMLYLANTQYLDTCMLCTCVHTQPCCSRRLFDLADITLALVFTLTSPSP